MFFVKICFKYMVMVYFSFAQNIIHHHGKDIFKKASTNNWTLLLKSWKLKWTWTNIYISDCISDCVCIWRNGQRKMLSLNSDLKQDSKWRICQKGCKKNESKNICFVESQLTSCCMKTILQSHTQKLLKV